eukprot:TRINITY_DN12634_c0_g1_i1.p1 TRINITY_DN12634_c0_g1~~TRINITY_DN12634_c0_g1_i1.p1  ORF type:complete len:314 (+),score=33.06 TRINITY_DN12634_c0_g1_i1:55-996(+)
MKTREWIFGEYILPSPPRTFEGFSDKTHFNNSTIPGGKKGFAGSTRRTQFESVARAELKGHESRLPSANCIAPPPSVSKCPTTLQDIWGTGQSDDIKQAVLEQVTTPGVTKRFMRERPHFNIQVHEGKLKEIDVKEIPTKSSFLKSAKARRKEAGEERDIQNAMAEMGSMRRTFNRLKFVSKNRHPGGILLSETPDDTNSGVYASVRSLRDTQEVTVETERKMKTSLQLSGNLKPNSGGSLMLAHSTEPCLRPLFQRKGHTRQDRQNVFSFSGMDDPGPLKKLRDTSLFQRNRGRVCDMISGIPVQHQGNPYV